MSSLLSATYVVPWPPFYETLLDTLGVINFDIGWIRGPLNAFTSWLGGATKDWTCNMNDMSAIDLFVMHYGMLIAVIVANLLAYGVALLCHKLDVMPKKFGSTFKPEQALATAIQTANFLVFLLCVFFFVVCCRCGSEGERARQRWERRKGASLRTSRGRMSAVRREWSSRLHSCVWASGTPACACAS